MPPDQQRQHRESGVGSRRMCLIATSADHRTRRAVRVIAARRPSNGGWTSCQTRCPSTGPTRRAATPCRGAQRSRPWRSGGRGARGARGAGAAERARVPADHHHQSAARLRPERRADDLLRRPGRADGRPALRQLPAAEHLHHAAVDRRLVVGRAGLECRGSLPRLERHPEQPAAALDRGRRPRLGVPHAVEQQQRQQLRLPGPAALLRARHPADRPLRARRLDHGAGGLLQRQAPELAERHRPPP